MRLQEAGAVLPEPHHLLSSMVMNDNQSSFGIIHHKSSMINKV